MNSLNSTVAPMFLHCEYFWEYMVHLKIFKKLLFESQKLGLISQILPDPLKFESSKVGLSPFKKFASIYSDVSPLKMVKGAFYFMFKALFALFVKNSFIKNKNWVYLLNDSLSFIQSVFTECLSRGLSKYTKTKELTTCFNHI